MAVMRTLGTKAPPPCTHARRRNWYDESEDGAVYACRDCGQRRFVARADVYSPGGYDLRRVFAPTKHRRRRALVVRRAA